MMKDADRQAVLDYVKAAEEQYKSIEDPGYLLARPLVDFVRTPINYYRAGILLSALEAGYHDVLDFGAGTCWLGAILYRLGSRVTFLEVSPTALELGKRVVSDSRPMKKYSTPPEFVAYDGFTFPLPDESIDRIICYDAFHHIPNPVRILDEMHRVLRNGGRIIMAEPGEGHGAIRASRQDMKVFGVLEADVHFKEISRTARDIGFSDVFFKPFPKVETLTMKDEEYLRYRTGDDSLWPHKEIRRDLGYFQIIVITKGPRIVDTRYPVDLRATIELEKKPSLLRPGRWRIRFINHGDTTWLSPVKKSPGGGEKILDDGGYVYVRVLLRDEKSALIDPWFYSCPLPHDLKPGEPVSIDFEFKAPDKPGKYILEFDLEARGHFMFSDGHLNQSPSDSLKVEASF